MAELNPKKTIRIRIPAKADQKAGDFWPPERDGQEVEVEIQSISFPSGAGDSGWGVVGHDFEIVREPAAMSEHALKLLNDFNAGKLVERTDSDARILRDYYAGKLVERGEPVPVQLESAPIVSLTQLLGYKPIRITID